MTQSKVPGPNLGSVTISGTVTEKQDQPAATAATWTSATTLNTALTVNTIGYGTAVVAISTPSTATAGAITIEVSNDGGTTWSAGGAVRSDNGLAENVVALGQSAALIRTYAVSVDSYTQVRARLSTVITGTGNTVVTVSTVAGGIEPLVSHLPPRVPFYFAWMDVTGTASVESALTNFSFGTKAGANVTAATSVAVAAGKTHRIASIAWSIRQTSTVLNSGAIGIRFAPTVANTSPVAWRGPVGTGAATAAAGILQGWTQQFPDGGLEIPGPAQWTVTWGTGAASCALSIAINGYEY